MSAFVRKEIDRQDLATLMHYYVAKRTFADCKLISLIGDSPENKELSDALVQPGLSGLVAGFQQKDFQQLGQELQKLPARKQIYWTYEALIDPERVGKDGRWQWGEFFLSPVGSLSASLVFLGSVLTYKKKEYTFSFDVDRLFLNAKYGKCEYNFCRPKLGLFTASEIKDGVEENRRLCATYFPGAPYVTAVHNSKELPGTVTKHDCVHAHVLQAYPADFLQLAKQLRAELATLTGIEMSKEVWEFTELIIISYLKLDYQKIRGYDAKAVLELLKTDTKGLVTELQWRDLLWKKENGREVPTVLFCLLDIKDPKPHSWTNLESGTIKQKIWHIQQQCRGINETVLPEDRQLAFRKVRTGKRKNTIELVRLQ